MKPDVTYDRSRSAELH